MHEEWWFDEDVNHLTKDIGCNPTSAIIYSTRDSVFVKMKEPNATIRDANYSIKITQTLQKVTTGEAWQELCLVTGKRLPRTCASLQGWINTLTLFGLLVIPVILYGCELWASNTTKM
jgi:hypothetical protein